MAEQKKFIGKYETILDHNPTPKEFEEITKLPWNRRFEFVEFFNGSTPHSGWSGIRRLYELRGDKKNAERYRNIPNEDYEAGHFDISL